MPRSVNAKALLLAFCWLAMPTFAGAFPFWLGSASRSNPHDPKSAAYVAQPTLVTAPLGTYTHTPTATATFTSSFTFTHSLTHTPTHTLVGANTATQTPTSTWTRTFTASPTHTATHTPTATPTETLIGANTATSTPTPTITPTTIVHNSLVADFENNAANDRTLWGNGTIFTIKDGVGSTQSPNPWGPASGTAGGAASSAFAACMSGTMAQQVTGTSAVNPYCFLMLELVTGGSIAGTGGVDVDLTSYSPNNGLKFDYKAGTAGVTYRVKLLSSTISDYGYYAYDFTATDTAWHTMSVYFPGSAGAPAVFAQPGWAAVKAFDKAKVGAVMFEVSQQTSGPVPYSLCVDNVGFDAPVYTPVTATFTPTPTTGITHNALLCDFESGSDNATLWGGSVYTGFDGIAGSTQSPNPWTVASATSPGMGGTGKAGCFSGHMVPQVEYSAGPPVVAGVYPAAYLALELLPGGNDGSAAADAGAYSPNEGVSFDYKAGAAGVQYRVKLPSTIHAATASPTGYYEYTFTSADTAWHTKVIYFHQFTQPGWAAAVPFDKSKIGAVQFAVVAQVGAAVDYSLCVDNVTFNVPVEVAHNALVADFEGADNSVTLWNGGSVLTGRDAIAGSVISPDPWLAGSATATGGFGSGKGARFSGHMPAQVEYSAGPPVVAGQYPYAFLALEIIPGGSNGTVGTDVTAYSPNNGIKFDYKAGAANVQYRIKLPSSAHASTTSPTGYYEYTFTATDTAWHTLTVYFSDFAQPGWAQAVAFDKSKLGAIQFAVVAQVGAAVDYDLTVDNVTFDVAAPLVPPALGVGTVIADWADPLASDSTNYPFSAAIGTGAGGGANINPWTITSAVSPGASGAGSDYCGEMTGTITSAGYAVMELQLAVSGWSITDGGGGMRDITADAPNQRLVFDYKAGAAGQPYAVQILTQNITNYSFYQYDWVAPDTDWHQIIVYFPTSPFTPKLTRTWGGVAAWDPTQAGEIIFRATPPATGSAPFDLKIDNLRFD